MSRNTKKSILAEVKTFAVIAAVVIGWCALCRWESVFSMDAEIISKPNYEYAVIQDATGNIYEYDSVNLAKLRVGDKVVVKFDGMNTNSRLDDVVLNITAKN